MTIRLFTNFDLDKDEQIILSDNDRHYLLNVMRKSVGDEILLFNGKDGEWRCVLSRLDKKSAVADALESTRRQDEEKLLDVWLCATVIKKDKMDLLIEKATELGVSGIIPVITKRTNDSHLSVEKMTLRAKEAAEQSERLSVPFIKNPIALSSLLEQWDKNRTLIYLNERTKGGSLEKTSSPIAFLIGPEGGFDDAEFEKLSALPYAKSVHLGRRILRAETAGISILAAWNQINGWI